MLKSPNRLIFWQLQHFRKHKTGFTPELCQSGEILLHYSGLKKCPLGLLKAEGGKLCPLRNFISQNAFHRNQILATKGINTHHFEGNHSLFGQFDFEEWDEAYGTLEYWVQH